MYQNKISIQELHTGYVVELNTGIRYLVARIGNFKKILVGFRDGQIYESILLTDCFDSYLDGIGGYSGISVIRVWGLSDRVDHIFNIDISHRQMIWSRKTVKKMTVAEISKELGYEVEIVKE